MLSQQLLYTYNILHFNIGERKIWLFFFSCPFHPFLAKHGILRDTEMNTKQRNSWFRENLLITEFNTNTLIQPYSTYTKNRQITEANTYKLFNIRHSEKEFNIVLNIPQIFEIILRLKLLTGVCFKHQGDTSCRIRKLFFLINPTVKRWKRFFFEKLDYLSFFQQEI